MTSPLSIERRGAVAVIRHANPPLGFMTGEMLAALRKDLALLERDPGVRVIVFTGVDGQYVLHTDVAELDAMIALTPPLPRWARRLLLLALPIVLGIARMPFVGSLLRIGSTPPARARTALLEMMLLFRDIERSSKITIAAINGHAVGGGWEMSLCFDLRVAVDDERVVLGLPEVLIGLMPGFGGTQRLLRIVGATRALELLLDGTLLSPHRAAELGLVNRVFSPNVFAAEVDELAERLARRPSAAVAAIKRAVRGGAERPLDAGLLLELCEVGGLGRTPETIAKMARYRSEIEAQLTRPEGARSSIGELVARLESGI
jgi:enoyl-CoA hydratase/carnithine racemase